MTQMPCLKRLGCFSVVHSLSSPSFALPSSTHFFPSPSPGTGKKKMRCLGAKWGRKMKERNERKWEKCNREQPVKRQDFKTEEMKRCKIYIIFTINASGMSFTVLERRKNLPIKLQTCELHTFKSKHWVSLILLSGVKLHGRFIYRK